MSTRDKKECASRTEASLGEGRSPRGTGLYGDARHKREEARLCPLVADSCVVSSYRNLWVHGCEANLEGSGVRGCSLACSAQTREPHCTHLADESIAPDAAGTRRNPCWPLCRLAVGALVVCGFHSLHNHGPALFQRSPSGQQVVASPFIGKRPSSGRITHAHNGQSASARGRMA